MIIVHGSEMAVRRGCNRVFFLQRSVAPLEPAVD
jgi:hypothetical protein